jgi:CRP-like cAMP-binding protein
MLRQWVTAMQNSLYVSPRPSAPIATIPIEPIPINLARLQYSRRSALPVRQGYLWKIETGVVRTLTWLEDGTIVTLGLWGDGEVVGKTLPPREPYQIECLTPVEVSLVLAHEAYRDPAPLLNQLRQTEELLVIRSAKKVEEMLLKLLVWLADRFGSTVKQGRAIDLKLTHQDMAELLGTTRVTVTRVLKQFEDQGLIQRLTRQIVLKQEDFWYYQI